MLSLSLCDYSDEYILVKGTITVAQPIASALNNASKKLTLKNCTPFTKYISMINNNQVDDAHDLDVVMQMCN